MADNLLMKVNVLQPVMKVSSSKQVRKVINLDEMYSVPSSIFFFFFDISS